MSPILVPTLAELRIELDRLIGLHAVAVTNAHAMLNIGQINAAAVDALVDGPQDAVEQCLCAIADLPAAAVADLRVKAYALRVSQTWGGDPEGDDPAVIDARLSRQIVAGLLDERIV